MQLSSNRTAMVTAAAEASAKSAAKISDLIIGPTGWQMSAQQTGDGLELIQVSVRFGCRFVVSHSTPRRCSCLLVVRPMD